MEDLIIVIEFTECLVAYMKRCEKAYPELKDIEENWSKITANIRKRNAI